MMGMFGRKFSYTVFVVAGWIGWWEALSGLSLVPDLFPGRWGLLLYPLAGLLLFSFSRVMDDLSGYIDGFNRRGRMGLSNHTEAAISYDKKSYRRCGYALALVIIWLLPWLLVVCKSS